MIVKLEGNANDVVTLGLQQRSRHRGIDAAGHGDDDPCVLRTAFKIQTVEHGFRLSMRPPHPVLRDHKPILLSEALERFQESELPYRTV
jgi:hypothetical protein